MANDAAPSLRSKLKGALLGGAIGDALGMAVETWTPEKICEVHGGPVTSYMSPVDHKWFSPDISPGTTTDDTQLTVATMKGLIAGHEQAFSTRSFTPYLDAIAAAHVNASQYTLAGWGKSTTEAIRRIANGVHWSVSGQTTEKQRGTGNGVCMKCSPLAFWLFGEAAADFDYPGTDEKPFQFNQRVVEFGAMTHYTDMAAESGVLHAAAVSFCLWSTKSHFEAKWFSDLLCDTVWDWQNKEDHNWWSTKGLNPIEDKLHDRISQIATLASQEKLKGMSVAELREQFGGGSCYVYDSLPFSYAFFLRDPLSAQTILDVVNAGGDTDTNAKMVGEMIGAIQGLELFEQPENRWMLDGLQISEELLELADQFCDTFEIV